MIDIAPPHPPAAASYASDALLAAFVARSDENAFAELTHRYIHFVHGVAARVHGDPAAADDVTQAVFILLAKKAGSIKSAAALPSWLHQTTLYAAANARKSLARRRYHERHAATLRPETVMPHVQNTESILPRLDHAIAGLAAADRALLLSRYFEGTAAAEIGRRIGISAEAAQKRIERATDKLRSVLTKPATPVTIAGVTTALATSSTHAAPPTLATSASRIALHPGVANPATDLARSTLRQMARPKRTAIKAAMVALAVLMVGLGVRESMRETDNTPPKDHPSLAQAAPPPAVDSPTTQPTQPAPPPSTAPAAPAVDDRVAIQGKWEFVTAVSNRQVAPPEQMKVVSIVITDTRFGIILPRPKNKEMATYTLNTETTPKQIDQIDAENKRRVVPGIYELDGDTLRIYFDDRNAKRPTAFPDAPEQASAKLWILHRVSEIPAH